MLTSILLMYMVCEELLYKKPHNTKKEVDKVNSTESVECPVIENGRIEHDIKLKGVLGSVGWLSKQNFARLQTYCEGEYCDFIKHDKDDDVFEVSTKTGRVWLTREEFELAQKYPL